MMYDTQGTACGQEQPVGGHDGHRGANWRSHSSHSRHCHRPMLFHRRPCRWRHRARDAAGGRVCSLVCCRARLLLQRAVKRQTLMTRALLVFISLESDRANKAVASWGYRRICGTTFRAPGFTAYQDCFMKAGHQRALSKNGSNAWICGPCLHCRQAWHKENEFIGTRNAYGGCLRCLTGSQQERRAWNQGPHGGYVAC
eukprot:1157619-Pelagomonas_calceolata.AAC.4